jgi:hypothetical protein
MKKHLILLILLVLSCRGIDQESPYEEKLVVYSILNPAFPKQFVIVDKTYKVNEEIPETTGLSGCELKVWEHGCADTVYFQEIAGKPVTYVDTESSPWVKPGALYHIAAAYEDKTLATHCTVPDTFSILALDNGDTVSLPCDHPLVWTESKGAAIYIIWPFFCGDSSEILAPLATIDTTVPLFSYEKSFFGTEGWYVIKVFANDTNRCNYGRGGLGLIDSMDTGFGLFGAQTFDTVRIYIDKP